MRTLLLIALLLFIAPASSAQTPKDADDFYNRGFDRQVKGDVEGALADYTRAITIDPRNASAYANRGVLRLQAGQTKLAEQDFDEAVKLDPSLKPSLGKYLEEMKKRKAND
ncbi:MAG TPA: tetratricopeptide repeat protein [Pyrinomonadaceae bacterium]|nr:tetratricopeptide repeat protein [Pyrinomonadaceae bacterium]